MNATRSNGTRDQDRAEKRPHKTGHHSKIIHFLTPSVSS